jgi:spermidine synthase
MRARLATAFALSGFAALVYETAWARLLRLAFGGTSEAHATVLAAFMGGLALGSWLGGRLVDRLPPRRALYFFAALEGGVASLALLGLPVLTRFPELYAGFERGGVGTRALRFLAAAVVLLPPTTLMGATLPLLARACVAAGEGLRAALGRLYAVNTAGAVAGALATGFALIPWLGVSNAIVVAAMLNLAAAGLASLVARRAPLLAAGAAARPRDARAPAKPESPAPPAPRSRRRLLLAAAALSGASALGLEVLWSRTLLLVVGSSTQAFALMLATFLGGIALGSLVDARFGGRLGPPARLAGLLQLCVASASILLLHAATTLPYAYVELWQDVHGSGAGLLLLRMLPSVALMLVPALFMGASLPALARSLSEGAPAGDRSGADVGAAWAANTAGAILGALVAALVALPLLGVARAASAIAAASVAAGLLALLASRSSKASLLPVAAAAAICAWVPPWNASVMGKGLSYLAFDSARWAAEGTLRRATEGVRVVHYQDGAESTVLVYDGGEGTRRAFVVNGRHEATTSPRDMRNQYLLGHLPALLHRGPVRDGLVIALGSGMTAGCLALHAGRVTVVELEPAVVPAAAAFAEWNHRAVGDPKVEIEIDDGRHFLLATSRRFDVITVDPIHPSVVGSDALYSVEQYELVRRRLAEGGVAAQWLPLGQMGIEDARSIVRTFLEAFPDAQLWLNGADAVLIGGAGTELPPATALRDALARPEIAASLAVVRQQKLATLLAGYALGAPDVARYAEGAPVLRDDRPRLEFSLPWRVYDPTVDPNLLEILRFGRRPPPISFDGLDDATRDEIGRAREALGADQIALALRVARHADVSDQFFAMALDLHPDDPFACDALGK